MRRFGSLAVLLTVVPLLAFGPVDRTAPTKWAFIVGISDYIHFSDETGGDLPGAERDARVMRDVLVQKWGFPRENVKMLLNQDATRRAIEEGLTEWLPARARPGDQITVFFAGHGSQMWDQDGDEEDGLDETIAPADVRSETTEFDISDDEFGDWLTALPTDNVVVYLDNCNSGTGTREVTPFSRTRELARDLSEIERPEGVARRAVGEGEDETGFDPGAGTVLELAAAQPHQAAVDAYFPAEEGGEAFHGGAFTTFLVRELWRAPSSATYQEVFQRVRDALERHRFEQDPYLSEEVEMKSAPLFHVEGGGGSVSEAALPVASVTDGMAELGGGQSLGITTGSVFTTSDGARLVVESVTPERAAAHITSGSVEEGASARLEGYRFARRPLRVNVAEVASETAATVSDAAAGSTSIQAVEDPDAFSHLLLRRRSDSVRVVGMDGATRGSYAADADGRSSLRDQLKKEAAAKRLADMENLAQEFEIEVWLEEGARELGLGEHITFHARSERSGYLTLVDLGTDGTVTVLYPNAYEEGRRIEAGETYTFPSEEMGFEIEVQPPPGRGIVRAFVTSEPLDIPLSRDQLTTGEVLLADRIADAVRSAAGAVEGSSEAVRLDSWGTASMVYQINP